MLGKGWSIDLEKQEGSTIQTGSAEPICFLCLKASCWFLQLAFTQLLPGLDPPLSSPSYLHRAFLSLQRQLTSYFHSCCGLLDGSWLL